MGSRDEGSAPLLPSGHRATISIELAMGTSIEALRLARQLTLEGLAGETGIPVTLLNEYEAGERRVSGAHVMALATALHVKVSTLFGLHPSMRP